MLNELMAMFGGLSPEQQIETIKYGTDAVGKLGLSVGKIFGYFYEPTHIKQMAEAEAFKRKQLADAKAYEIQKVGEAIETQQFLPLIYRSEDGTVAVDTSDAKQLMQRSNIRLQNLQIQKERNIESVIGKTALELEGKEADINDEVDNDWLNRYFNIVEDISDEDMQNLWARILEGEILKPRTYSLRLLEFLHSTSKEELDRILKIASFVLFDGLTIQNAFIIQNDKMLEDNKISFDDILFYSEIGILHSNIQVCRTYSIQAKQKQHLIFYSREYVCIGNNKNNTSQEFNFSVYSVTKLGIELLKLANIPTDKGFCIENIKRWGHKYHNIEFLLYKIQSINGDGVIYDDKNPLIEVNKD